MVMLKDDAGIQVNGTNTVELVQSFTGVPLAPVPNVPGTSPAVLAVLVQTLVIASVSGVENG